MAPGPVAARKRHTADLWVRDQGVADVMVDHDNLKQVFGQTRLDTQIAQPQTGPGADAGVLQEASVACHEVGGEHAH